MTLFRATVREVGDVAVVDLGGALMIGESSAILRNALLELVRKDRTRIILNFRGVSTMDSAGVGELIAAYALIKDKCGLLKLLDPPKKVHEVLKLTRLSKVFETFTDERSALRSFDKV